MDLQFLLRAERILEPNQPAQLDHDMLVATVNAQQATCPTVRAQAEQPPVAGAESLVELVLAENSWRKAASRRRGCFNRSIAGRHVNGA